MSKRGELSAPSRSEWRLVAVGLLGGLVAGCPPVASSSPSGGLPASSASTAAATASSAVPAPSANAAADLPVLSSRMLESGLVIEELVLGTGAEAKAGDKLIIHYVGRLGSGYQFDSTYASGQPLRFELGRGRLIQGLDDGIPGMRVGGKRRLLIPPTLAYGSRGSLPEIPPDAILEFDIELVDIAPP